jgi:hypothetical protein
MIGLPSMMVFRGNPRMANLTIEVPKP